MMQQKTVRVAGDDSAGIDITWIPAAGQVSIWSHAEGGMMHVAHADLSLSGLLKSIGVTPEELRAVASELEDGDEST